MNKKIMAGVLAIVLVSSVGYFSLSKNKKSANDKSSEKTSNTKVVVQEFKVKSIFADVDMDMVVQDKDAKDDDKTGDYIFISFNANIEDTKKNDGTNPFYIKNYKLDGKELPEGSKIGIVNGQSSKLIIKLPDGYLKGINAPHSLEISKELKNKEGKVIKGDSSVKLPYSKSNEENNDNSSGNTADSKNAKNSDNSNESKDKKAAENVNKDMPKYTIELGKAIPFTTVVIAKLDTKTPENYKVTVEGVNLELKENSNKEKVFIGSIKKDYEIDQVKKVLKIDKVK